MAGRDVRVCFFGDSFVAGVGDTTGAGWVGRLTARAVESGYMLTAYNLGVRRETSLDVERRLVSEAACRLRDGDRYGVVISIGVNDSAIEDGTRRVAEADTRRAVEAMVTTATERGWSALIVGPAPVGDLDHSERILALSEMLDDLCRRLGLAFVGIASQLAQDATWLGEVGSWDGAHPRAAGYGRLTELIWPAFDAWLQHLADA